MTKNSLPSRFRSISLATATALSIAGCSGQAKVDDAAATVHTVNKIPIEDAPAEDQLRDKLDEAIEITRTRLMSPQVNNAWQVVHGILAFGEDLQLNDNGKPVFALEYLLNGGYLNGWKFVAGEKGLDDVLDPGSKAGQGHEDQWLGYLSQCEIDPNRAIKAAGGEYKVADLITEAQWDLRKGQEATWTLMALSTYLPLDAQWTSKDGDDWTLEELVAMEAANDLAISACGGSHRLYGLAVALNRHINEGGELEGGWKLADEKIQGAILAAHEFQQPDGAFSVNYFQRSADSPEVGVQINTTGHVLEFLATAMSDKQLAEPWVARSANFLSDMLIQTKDFDLECGGLYHAVHGLEIYRFRRFGKPGEADASETAAN